MLHRSRFRIRTENSPQNPWSKSRLPPTPLPPEPRRLSAPTRPWTHLDISALVFKALNAMIFQAGVFCHGCVCMRVCVLSVCKYDSRCSAQALNSRSKPRANRGDSIIFFPHRYSEKTRLLLIDWLQKPGIQLDCLVLCAEL